MERWKQVFMVGMAAFGIWLAGGMQAEAAVPIDDVNFPDPVIQAHVKIYDLNNDGMLSNQELEIPNQMSVYANLAQTQEEGLFSTKPGTIVDFKGMENFPNIRELSFRGLGKNKDTDWNYGGSDLLRCFPHVEKIDMSGPNDLLGEGGQITLSGKSDQLKEVRIDSFNHMQDVIWNLEAKNLQYVEIHANEINGLKNTMGELSSLESLTLTCNKMQHCNLAFAKMPLLKNLTLISFSPENIHFPRI